MAELYNKYRPRSLDEVVGQPVAVEMLRGFMKKGSFPQATLLTGPSGCGKTTIARIIKRHLKCRKTDYQEINCAQERGIDTIRAIDKTMWASPMFGSKKRIYYFDECHQLASKDVQSALLKMIEDPPKKVVFIFGTTHPSKMLRTIITRCKAIDLKLIQPKDMAKLISDVCKKEKGKLSQEVLDKIVECSEGSARMGLQHLERVLQLVSDKDRLALLSAQSDGIVQGIDLIRFIVGQPLGIPTFQKAAKMIGELEGGVEDVRLGILGYVSSMLVKPLPQQKMLRCLRIIRCFQDNFMDSGNSKAGLLGATYEVCTGLDLP